MARWLPTDPESYVLELGPGTGPVTAALLKRGLREEKLIAIEHNPKMARLLREKFPRAQIITGDAWQLDDLLRGAARAHDLRRRDHFQPAAGEFSRGTRPRRSPKKSAPCWNRRDIWVQFSYQIHKLRPRGASSFKLRASKIVWLNFPPARVSVFRK